MTNIIKDINYAENTLGFASDGKLIEVKQLTDAKFRDGLKKAGWIPDPKFAKEYINDLNKFTRGEIKAGRSTKDELIKLNWSLMSQPTKLDTGGFRRNLIMSYTDGKGTGYCHAYIYDDKYQELVATNGSDHFDFKNLKAINIDPYKFTRIPADGYVIRYGYVKKVK